MNSANSGAMLKSSSWWLRGILPLLLCCSLPSATNVLAEDAVAVKTPEHSVSINISSDGKVNVDQESHSEDSQDSDSEEGDKDKDNSQHHYSNHDTVQIFGDAMLAVGQSTHDLISVMGSSTNDGTVSHDVVSIFGNTRVTGMVGHDAIAVMGSNYVNNKVDHDVLAIFGDVELGPQAEIGHEVVVVGGSLKRDPAAIVKGHVQTIGPHLGFEWLHAWLSNCLFKARLLAFDSSVTWAWSIALIALLTYLLTALLFPKAINRCADVMEEHPGHVVLASIFTIIGIPMVIILLAITVVGIIAIPFVGLALMIGGFVGKVAILAWIGRRMLKKADGVTSAFPVLAVLLAGIVVMLIYVVPVLSLLVYKALGFLGLGVAVYTLLLEIKSRRDDKLGANQSGGATNAADLADVTPASSATSTSSNESADDTSASATTPVAPSTVLNELPRAGFWIRMVALALDAVLIGFITSMVIHPRWFGVDTDHVIVTLLAIYGAVMWKFKGATVGDIVFKLQVVRADGRPIDWPTAIVRSLGCFLSVMVIGLGFIWIAFDEHKQSWHDKIAGTLVVRNPKVQSLV